MTTICIDMGGTSIKAGIVEGGKLKETRSTPSHAEKDFNSTISRISALIRELMDASEYGPEELGGIGLGVPGIVNVDRNIVLDINKKHIGAIDYDFNVWCSGEFNLPLVMENDARAALVGEWKNGAGAGFDNIVMITLGTGVGGAALINGNLLYGKHYQAGCLGGHFTVNYNGRRCTCGNIGCVEAEASSWSLDRLVEEFPGMDAEKETGEGSVDFEQLFAWYGEGNKTAREIISHCLKVWSSGIVSLIHAYDPELVILSGGIMKSKQYIVPFVQEWVDRYAWTPGGRVEVRPARWTQNAALYGLNHLISNKIIKESS